MKRVLLPVLAFVLVAAAFFYRARHRHSAPSAAAVVAARIGALEVWSPLDGFVESRQVREIMSDLQGAATIIELAPDGAAVREGDVLVRFDASLWDREKLRLVRDAAVAREEFNSLSNAKLPLERQDLESRAAAAWLECTNEAAALEDSHSLLGDGLISTQEVARQVLRLEQARGAAARVEKELQLTVAHLHPAALARARAVLEAAEQEVLVASRQISNCVVRAPCDGLVAYKAISLGSEFRTVRVGDGVFRNQPFLTVSDMASLVARCTVPESDLVLAPVGAPARIRPVAYPDVQLKGSIEAVGGMAQSLAGRPAGLKYFSVTVRIDERDPRLRAGMSVEVSVLSHANPRALLVPRAAVEWDGDRPCCRVVRAGGAERVPVTLGRAGITHVEVVSGLGEGDSVLTP
jgi:HlyD family secretion protein